MAKSKRGPGRPPLPQSQRLAPHERSRPVNTTLAPDLYRFVEQLGDGSASRGVREAVRIALISRGN